MPLPFAYGQVVEPVHFVNRNSELQSLTTNFVNAQNTIVVAPRRWGKSLLIDQAIRRVSERQHPPIVARLDLTAIRSEAQFYEAFLRAVLTAAEDSTQRQLRLAREFLRQLTPKLKFSANPGNEIAFAVDWAEAQPYWTEVLDLPQRIAESQERPVVVAIDEFQQIAEFPGGDFDGVLRSRWQYHTRVCYCLYGSKHHLMSELFGSYKRPFYLFGEMLFLDLIDEDEWADYIVDRFERFGKRISLAVALHLVRAVHSHSHYVQHLAHVTFERTEKSSPASTETVDRALDALVDSLRPLFEQLIDGLTQKQLNYLWALADGATELSSGATVKRYKLGSPSGVAKLKATMRDRDFTYRVSKGKEGLLDPVFATWLYQTMPRP